MRYQRALSGILLTVVVTASIFMGMATISQSGTDGRTSVGLQRDTTLVASAGPAVPTWGEINHTKFFIDTSEAPRANVSAADIGVLGVAASWKNRTFSRVSSINATNLQPNMALNYTDIFSINCTQLVASNYTVRLNTPVINTTWVGNYTSFSSNAKSIRIKCATNQTAFAYDYGVVFNDPINGTIYGNKGVTRFSNTMHFWDFNISKAVQVFESTSLYVGASYTFEVNYTIPVEFVFTESAMGTKIGQNFRIEGNQSTRGANLTLTFSAKAPEGVNITFHYLPADSEYTGNFRFYKNGIEMQKPDFTAGLGWRIPKSGIVNLNSTGTSFRIEFNCTATVGFVEQNAGRWNSDGIASSLATRTRKYKLAVLSGPSTLLIERVEFTANDVAYPTVFLITRAVTPTSGLPTLTEDTYKYYDPILQDEVTKSNGTKCVIGRIQKTDGPVVLSFNYDASYSATLRILDELRNPLPGAEVTLYFHGIRFGPLMSPNETNLQPSKIANSLGSVTYENLPEGNFSVEVRFQDWVKTQEFSLYGATKSVSIDVVTDVPYQPWILVSWILIFGILCMLGIVLFKRKR